MTTLVNGVWHPAAGWTPTVVLDAASQLEAEGWIEEVDDLITDHAGVLHALERHAAAGEISDAVALAEEYMDEGRAEYQRSLPRAPCVCGREYALYEPQPGRGRPDAWTTTDDGMLAEKIDHCPCGRELAQTLGVGRQRGQLGLSL